MKEKKQKVPPDNNILFSSFCVLLLIFLAFKWAGRVRITATVWCLICSFSASVRISIRRFQ